MASAISPLGSSGNTDPSSSSSTSASTTPATEQTFLTLLVAQLQNQDPLSPVDGTQFVTQLAQFSQLEQTIGIRQDIEAYHTAAAAANSAVNTTNNNGATPASS